MASKRNDVELVSQIIWATAFGKDPEDTMKESVAGFERYQKGLSFSVPSSLMTLLKPIDIIINEIEIKSLRKSISACRLPAQHKQQLVGMSAAFEQVLEAQKLLTKYKIFNHNIRDDWKHLDKIVSNIKVSRGTLSFVTPDIICKINQKNGQAYDLGKFKITINRGEEDEYGGYDGYGIGAWHFEKHTKKDAGGDCYYDHPNVGSDGLLCIGAGAVPFINAIKEGRLFDAIETVLSVLRTCPKGHIDDLKHIISTNSKVEVVNR